MMRSVSASLVVLVGLLCLFGAAAAGPPRDQVETDRGFVDQVAHPGEAEDADLVLADPPVPAEYDTPEKVRDHVAAALGADAEWTWDSSAANLVVVRKAGSGYHPAPLESPYDDLFLVVTRDRVLAFAHGNAEGTVVRAQVERYGYTQYVDAAVGQTMTPALAPGCYRFLVGLHAGEYEALRVTDMQYERVGLPSQRRNGKFGKYEVGGVNVHKGGSTWNWSVGCLTLHYASYAKFIALFTQGEWGRLYLLGDWNAPAERRPVPEWTGHREDSVGE